MSCHVHLSLTCHVICNMSCHVHLSFSRPSFSLSFHLCPCVFCCVCVFSHSDMSWCNWGDEVKGHGKPTTRRGFGERRAGTWEGAHLQRRAKTCAETDLRIGSHTAARLGRQTAARLEQDKCTDTHSLSLSV